jgi:hypothetical protein
MKRILTAVLVLGFSSTAFAVQILNYTVPLGTVTKYQQTSTTKTNFSNINFSLADGSSVSQGLQQALQEVANANFKDSKSITEIATIETVLELQSDGTRIVETGYDSMTNSIVGIKLSPASKIKFNTKSAYHPDGKVEILNVKYDPASFPNAISLEALSKLETEILPTLQQATPHVYGTEWELGQPLFFEYQIRNTGLNISSRVSESRTLTSIGTQGQFEFQALSKVDAYKTTIDPDGTGNTTLEYNFPESTLNIFERYLNDGRLERSVSHKTTTYGFRFTLKLSEKTVIVTGNTTIAQKYTANILP